MKKRDREGEKTADIRWRGGGSREARDRERSQSERGEQREKI